MRSLYHDDSFENSIERHDSMILSLRRRRKVIESLYHVHSFGYSIAAHDSMILSLRQRRKIVESLYQRILNVVKYCRKLVLNGRKAPGICHSKILFMRNPSQRYDWDFYYFTPFIAFLFAYIHRSASVTRDSKSLPDGLQALPTATLQGISSPWSSSFKALRTLLRHSSSSLFVQFGAININSSPPMR